MPSASALVNQLLTPGVTLSAEQMAAVAAIENALRTTGVALLSGPAGSGKTSRVVPAVEHVGWTATTHRAAYVLNQTRESRNGGGGARARTVHSQFFRYIGEPDDQLGRGAPPWAKAWFSNWARGCGELFIPVFELFSDPDDLPARGTCLSATGSSSLRSRASRCSIF
jgi:hypothetical protein